MALTEDTYYQASADGVDLQHSVTRGRRAFAIIGLSCVLLFAFAATSPTLSSSTSAPASLASLAPRMSGRTQQKFSPNAVAASPFGKGMMFGGVGLRGLSVPVPGTDVKTLAAPTPQIYVSHHGGTHPTNRPKSNMPDFGKHGPWAKLAISAVELNGLANGLANQRRGVSMQAARNEFRAVLASTDEETGGAVEKMKEATAFKIEEMAGVTAPFGFFDPAGISTYAPEGRVLFMREVELKHGRVGMLATLGLLVGEKFHPLFGGDIDVPSYVAFQQTPLQAFWPAVVAAIAIPEAYSVFTFKPPTSLEDAWTVKSGRVPGDLGWDPLGLKPKDPKEFKEMQNKEINNGRLAMLAAAGIIMQEIATGEKIF